MPTPKDWKTEAELDQVLDDINARLESEETKAAFAKLGQKDYEPTDEKEILEQWLDEGGALPLPLWVSKKTN